MIQLKKLFSKCLYTEDSAGEYEQAVLRVIIGGIVFLYFIIFNKINSAENLFNIPVVILTGLYVLNALINYASFCIYQNKSIIRRTYTLLTDLIVLSYGLHLGGASSTIFFSIYLWVIVGFGMRFGQIYLLAGTVLGSSLFTLVLFNTDYWIQQRTAGIGLLIGLIVLPIFFSSLLKKLTDARASAEEANRSKSQFLANMSHEIRTPLNGVICMIDILNTTKLSNEQKDLTNTLKSSANSLLTIIEDILDISKIEAGHFEIEQTEFDLYKLVKNTISIMNAQAETKNIKLTHTIDAATPYNLIGDPHHLRQVFINLIGNAIKFTEDGYVKLDIRTLYQDDDSVKVRFEVIDTGIGITIDSQADIFNSFTQADSSTTRKYGGTGLGTTISKNIIELMDGSIGLISKEGEGSTFWFEITFNKKNDTKSLDDIGLSQNKFFIISCNIESELEQLLKEWNLSYDFSSDTDTSLNILYDDKSKNKYSCLILDLNHISSKRLEYADYLKRKDALTSILLVDSSSYNFSSHECYEHINYVVRKDDLSHELSNALHAISADKKDSSTVLDFSEYKIRNNINRLQILVAEDNTTNQIVIRNILERANYEPHIVCNGQEALDELERNNYDLVIMDMQMPVMGGIEAAKIYNFTRENEKLPIIILTANATTEALKECEEANIDAYLTKPIKINRLLQTIDSLTASATDPTSSFDEVGIVSNEHKANKINAIEEIDAYINYELLDEVVSLSGETNFANQLILGYIKETENHLEMMKKLIVVKDYTALREALHAIKGSSGSIGAQAMSRACTVNHDELSSEEDYVSLINQIYDIFQSTKLLLKDFANERPMKLSEKK